MKISITLFGLWMLMSPFILFSQKFDNVWVMGYNWDDDPEAETYRLNFDTFPPRLEIYPGDLRIVDAYAGFCDSTGVLQVYTNNCSVADGEGRIIVNGESMSLGWEQDWCQTYGWHLYDSHNLFLPMTLDKNKVFLFSKTAYKSSSPPLVIYQDKFNYSIIDLKGVGGEPAVLEKNRTIIEARLGYGQVTAVKHGNGRDWWIPIPEELGNKIFMAICFKDSLYIHHSQNIGPTWGDAGSFQAAFSQDGSMYARYNRYYGLYLYDFDRCDGTLSNLRYFPFITTTQGLRGGVGFSPDNNLLYFADYDSLYQLDLTSSDILSTKKLVAVYDGYINGLLGTKFSRIVQGPDGRVYIIPPGTTRSMHVIKRPNLTGEACDVKQHFIDFPNPYGNPPNHPNFRLGPLDGSPCDTLGIDNHPLADFRPDPTDTNALAIRFWDVSSYEPVEWLWDFGDGSPVSQDTSPVHTFPASGFYTVCLTVANQYSASSKCKVVEVKATSGLSPLSYRAGPGVRLYPNPTTSILHWSELAEGSVSGLRVYDALGRLCLEQENPTDNVDISVLPGGLYQVTLLGEQGRVLASGRVVLVR